MSGFVTKPGFLLSAERDPEHGYQTNKPGRSALRSVIHEHLQERQQGMKENYRMLRGAAAAASAGLFCLLTGSAIAQTGGGRGGGVQSTRAASATGSTGSSNSSMAGGCNKSGSTSSSGTTSSTGTTTGTTVSGSTSSSGTVAAQSSGVITAQRTATTSAIVQYTGSTSNISKLYLAVLDANGGVVSQRLVTPGRPIATLAVNSSSRYYGVMVVYANGTTKSAYAPVR